MANNGELYILAIVFLRRTQCNKDQLYLFDIANRPSHGRIGEQVRSDSENWLKLWHMYNASSPLWLTAYVSNKFYFIWSCDILCKKHIDRVFDVVRETSINLGF